MTRLFIVFTAFATVVGLFYFRSAQREQLQRISVAEAAAQEAHARASDADQFSDRLKREMLKLQAEELLRPRPTTPSTNSTAQKTEHPAARLFRDPEMRAAMKKQHEKMAERAAKQLVNSNL